MVEFISSRAAGTISAVFVGVGLLRGCFSSILLILLSSDCVNGWVFLGAALCGWFIILSTLFILTYMERKFSGEHSLRLDF